MVQHINLVMIVKNEAEVITRCLESVLPYISHWTICDTGSTDGTPDIIAKFMAAKHIPGNLYQDEWVNFGHNRTLAMERAKGSAEYHLLLDADMVFHFRPPDAERAEAADDRAVSTKQSLAGRLKADAYLIPFEGPIDYSVVRLVSDRHPWRYIGKTHEYVHADTLGPEKEKLEGASIEHHEDGGSRSNKYARDIQLLTGEFEELEADEANQGVFKELGQKRRMAHRSRTAFYLAQSYRDCGQFENALDWYERRVDLGGWEEETWCSLYNLGCIQERLGYDWRAVLNSYLQAYNFRPTRLEPIYRIAKFYCDHRQWALGYHFARLVTEVGYPSDILFIERAVYEHLLAEVYAVCCRETGRVEEAERVETILGKGRGSLSIDH